MTTLQFDEAKHEYHVGGRRLLSMTQILDMVGLIDKTWYTPEACERGKLVHLALEFYDLGELDEDTLDPAIAPYLSAWKEFRRVSECQIVEIEHRVCNEVFGYAGTADRWLRIDGRDWLIDIKTGQPEPWNALQTAAYARCIKTPFQRGCVYIKADGSYKLMAHTDPTDTNVFLSAVAVANWKMKHRSSK